MALVDAGHKFFSKTLKIMGALLTTESLRNAA